MTPTVATIFAIPQIAFFGYALQYIGFPISLLLLGVVALCGVLLIRKGLSFPIPVVKDHHTSTDAAEFESKEFQSELELIDDA